MHRLYFLYEIYKHRTIKRFLPCPKSETQLLPHLAPHVWLHVHAHALTHSTRLSEPRWMSTRVGSLPDFQTVVKI